MAEQINDVTRRGFVKTAAATAAVMPMASSQLWAHAGGRATLRVGVIGCGGRGTGAANNALEAAPNVEVVALADAFSDQVQKCRDNLVSRSDRAKIRDEHCFSGFDAYKRLLETDVDIVILATPPHFRPMHFEEAIHKGKHVFMEKPVAVDGPGVRKVIAAAEIADSKNLRVVAGTQRRHERSYLEAMKRVKDGAIGEIVAARCYWNMGELWVKEQKPEWSDMEWQIRNWLYFAWLSGDHIVEQHIHNLDVVNWAMGGPPTMAQGMGGRQVRTAPKFGHIFDHFAIEYRYPNGAWAMSMCRQTNRCSNRVEEIITGSNGTLHLRPGKARIEGAKSWEFSGNNPNPYVQEHKNLIAAIEGNSRLNEGRRVANSTLTAILGRNCAYSGQDIKWDQMMNSKLDLSPKAYKWGSLEVPAIAMPGKYRFS